MGLAPTPHHFGGTKNPCEVKVSQSPFCPSFIHLIKNKRKQNKINLPLHFSPSPPLCVSWSKKLQKAMTPPLQQHCCSHLWDLNAGSILFSCSQNPSLEKQQNLKQCGRIVIPSHLTVCGANICVSPPTEWHTRYFVRSFFLVSKTYWVLRLCFVLFVLTLEFAI